MKQLMFGVFGVAVGVLVMGWFASPREQRPQHAPDDPKTWLYSDE